MVGDAWFLSFTFHGANGTVAFAELEVWGVADFKGDFLTMAAAFVLCFCVHGTYIARLIDLLLQNNKAVSFR